MRRAAFHRPFARVSPRDLPFGRYGDDEGDESDGGGDKKRGGEDSTFHGRSARRKSDRQNDNESSVTRARIDTTRTARPAETAAEASRRRRRLTYD